MTRSPDAALIDLCEELIAVVKDNICQVLQ